MAKARERVILIVGAGAAMLELVGSWSTESYRLGCIICLCSCFIPYGNYGASEGISDEELNFPGAAGELSY